MKCYVATIDQILHADDNNGFDFVCPIHQLNRALRRGKRNVFRHIWVSFGLYIYCVVVVGWQRHVCGTWVSCGINWNGCDIVWTGERLVLLNWFTAARQLADKHTWRWVDGADCKKFMFCFVIRTLIKMTECIVYRIILYIEWFMSIIPSLND